MTTPRVTDDTPINDPGPASGRSPDVDDSTGLETFMADYRPACLGEPHWLGLAPAAIAVVREAGPLTRGRVEKDLQTFASVAAHLLARHRALSVEAVLSDQTLLDYDLYLQREGKSDKTRENRRGILRRLQAAHRGLPWRAPRRGEGQRLTHRPGPESVTWLRDLLQHARQAAEDPGAEALLDVVAAARRRRYQGGDATVDRATWRRAVNFAQARQSRLNGRLLADAVLHELLAQDEPLAVIATGHALTRYDLDLAVTHLRGLPALPTPPDLAALRG